MGLVSVPYKHLLEACRCYMNYITKDCMPNQCHCTHSYQLCSDSSCFVVSPDRQPLTTDGVCHTKTCHSDRMLLICLCGQT